jgi:hypothetical protein
MDNPAQLTSVQKVHAALAQLDGLNPEDPSAQAIVLALTMLRPKVVEMLPSEPEQLDALLLYGAAWALRLRSDDAAPFDVDELLGRPPAAAVEPAP